MTEKRITIGPMIPKNILKDVYCAASGIQLKDYRVRSVWQCAKEEGRYVRDVLEKRYRQGTGLIHCELNDGETAAITQVAEGPPLPVIDLRAG